MYSMDRICLQCGKDFHAPANNVEKGYGKYCSSRCYGKTLIGRIPWNKGKDIFINCKFCKKEFRVEPNMIKNGRKKYCSKICKNLSQKGKPTWNKGKNIQMRNCLFCQKEFIARLKLINRGGAKYCSQKCYKDNFILKNTGENNLSKRFDIREKISKANKGRYSREFFQKIASLSNKSQSQHKKPTSIEIKLYDELTKRGILFEKQKVINDKFVVDAWIPKLNLIVEADGDYWHSLPRVVKRDKAKNAYLNKCKFKLLRLTETEIRDNSFITKLERMVM